MSTDSTQSFDLLVILSADVHPVMASSSTGLSNRVSKLACDLNLLNVTGVLQKKNFSAQTRKSIEEINQNIYPDSLDHFVAGSKVNKAVSSDFAPFFGV